MQWQPIETAPKDGTCILVSNPGSTIMVGFYVAYWSDEIDEWMYSNDRVVRSHTHWTHLPPPPPS